MELQSFIGIVQPYSMTSIERITELFNSLEYIRSNNIEGDIIECGVWKGGNIKGILEYLNYYEMHNVTVWLYDTFSGMTEPDENDIDLHGNSAKSILESVMCYASIEDVKNVLSGCVYPEEKIRYVIGDVLETLEIKENLPTKISLLRLDTDWYQSTKKELEILYPKLVKDGVLIVDDYGHWSGSKKAVDEYFGNFKESNIHVIDYTGIKIIKT
jgi:hypothetical protein